MKKDLKEILNKIKVLRETKGKEKETLELIDKTKLDAIEQNDYKTLVFLYWEESLNWQHIVMSETAKDNPSLDAVKEEALKMENAALHADRTINDNKLEELKGISYRFLGNSLRVNQKYDLAEIELNKAIDLFKKKGENTAQHLEIQGFLAAVYVFQGKVNEGIELAEKTFNEFEDDEKALELKNNDYTTWAIWASGIFPRLVEALVAAEVDFDKEKIIEFLEKSGRLLENPENKPTWGEEMFKYRLDEIKKSKAMLG